MAKVHRAFRHRWWKQCYPFAGMTYSEWWEQMNRVADLSIITKERFTLPFVHDDGDGVLLHVPLTKPSPPPSDQKTQQERLEQNRARREKEHLGVPGYVEDVLEWYYAYLKLADVRSPDKQVSLTKDGKDDYYRDVIIDLYRKSGYSIDDSVRIAYSEQGDELRRYLSDDKRHPLNRNHVDDEEEITSAILSPYKTTLAIYGTEKLQRHRRNKHMNRNQARALLQEMRDDDYHGEVKQIGNGEYCVVVNWLFLWSRADWRNYKKGKLASMETIKQEVEASA